MGRSVEQHFRHFELVVYVFAHIIIEEDQKTSFGMDLTINEKLDSILIREKRGAAGANVFVLNLGVVDLVLDNFLEETLIHVIIKNRITRRCIF